MRTTDKSIENSLRRLATVATIAGALAIPVMPGAAQEAGQGGASSTFRVQPSTRARTTVTLVRGRGEPAARIVIDYGQPHARGRTIVGSPMVPFDVPWRTGANEATSLVTDVDLTIGGVAVPKGSYTLYTLPSRTGPWKLIINKNTGQWGTEYAPEHDLARVDLRSRTLRDPLDSFSIWLVPDVTRNAEGGTAGGLPRGVLRLAWGEIELSTDWAVR